MCCDGRGRKVVMCICAHLHSNVLCNCQLQSNFSSNNKYSQQQHQTKETLSFNLQISQQVNLQIQFQPFKKQIYSSNLIIRNNLTIIDAY